jgi:DNA gyrase subunit B
MGSGSNALYGVEAVQKRPGMYIGSTDDGSGLHEMVFEVVANAVNEGLAGYCSRIDVMLAVNGAAIVSDDGRGVPVDIRHREGISKAEFVMTRLHAGALERDPEIPGTLHGVGLCVVNALSLWLELRIWRDGAEYFMRFHEGHPTGALQLLGGSNGKRGTEITFLPNPRIFTGTSFDFATLEARFRELGSLGANVTLVLTDKRGVDKKEAVIKL